MITSKKDIETFLHRDDEIGLRDKDRHGPLFSAFEKKILLEERDENALQEYQEDQKKAKDQIHMLDCISVYPITISPDKK